MSKLNWTDEMIALLKELYPNETIGKVASLLGVGRTSVKNKATELGLEKGIKREWLEKVEEVRKLNSTLSLSEIADKVGVSERTVSRIKAYLNISKNKEEEKAMRSRIRNEILQRERRRMIFGLDPITKIKIVTNKKKIELRHRFKKMGCQVSRGANTVYYTEDIALQDNHFAAGKKLGLHLMLIPT